MCDDNGNILQFEFKKKELKFSQHSIDNITSGLFISNANFVSGLQ
jgi:hypothetical protein